MPSTQNRASRDKESGFAMSAELLLIALVLIVGLITGWVKFRDQSSAEIKDAINAIENYIAGVAPSAQPYAQQWIIGAAGAGAVGCNSDPAGTQPVPPATCAAPITERFDPDNTYGLQGTAVITPLKLKYRPGVLSSSDVQAVETTVF